MTENRPRRPLVNPSEITVLEALPRLAAELRALQPDLWSVLDTSSARPGLRLTASSLLLALDAMRGEL